MTNEERTKEANIRGYVLEVYRDPEDGSWVAEVPELPGCVAATEDPGELFTLTEDAIDAWIEAARSDGRTVPEPRGITEDYSGRFLLRVSKTLHRKLVTEARRDGVSLNSYCVGALSEMVGAGVTREWVFKATSPSPVAAYYGFGVDPWSGATSGFQVIAEVDPAYQTSASQVLTGSANVAYLAAKHVLEQGAR